MIFRRRAAYPAAIAALGLLAATAGGCAWSTTSVDGSSGIPANPSAGSLNTLNQITVQRAGYVATMLMNTSAGGPETEGGVMSVVAGYGGGYATDASLSGAPGPAQKLTLAVVLGGGSVSNSMQGETDMGLAAVACYSFTVTYYGYDDTEAVVACPSTLTTASAQATATRQIAEESDALRDNAEIGSKSIPTTLAQAEQVIEHDDDSTAASAAAGLTAANFATGTDPVQHKPDAALAIPQSGGGCVFVVYRWIQASWVGGGSAGTADSAETAAWAAPTDAACTGAAALSAGAFLTADRYAGG